MDQATFRLASAGSGIVFFVLILLSFIFGPGEPPGFNDSTETVAAYVSDNRGEFQAVMALTIAAGPFLLLFLAGLARTLRLSEERGPAMLAAVAFAGGILIVAFAVIGSGLQWAASYQGEFIEMDPGVVRVLWEGGAIAFVATAGIGFVALVGATSAVALATGALPRLLGAAGAVLAVYAFVVAIIATFAETGPFAASDGALGIIAFLAFLVWILLVSVAMLPGKGEAAESAGP